VGVGGGVGGGVGVLAGRGCGLVVFGGGVEGGGGCWGEVKNSKGIKKITRKEREDSLAPPGKQIRNLQEGGINLDAVTKHDFFWVMIGRGRLEECRILEHRQKSLLATDEYRLLCPKIDAKYTRRIFDDLPVKEKPAQRKNKRCWGKQTISAERCEPLYGKISGSGENFPTKSMLGSYHTKYVGKKKIKRKNRHPNKLKKKVGLDQLGIEGENLSRLLETRGESILFL